MEKRDGNDLRFWDKLAPRLWLLGLAAVVSFYILTRFGRWGTLLWALLAVAALLGISIHCYRIERQAASNRQMFEALIINIRGGIEVTTVDPDPDRILASYISDGFTDITGYTKEDIDGLFGGRCMEIVYEKDRKWVAEELAAQCVLGNRYSMEYRVVRKDGTMRWVQDRGQLVQNRDGQGLQAHSVITDITAIKEQQEQLRISNERFRLTFTSSDNALFEFDCRRRYYVEFTNAIKMIGKSCQQLNYELTNIQGVEQTVADEMIATHFYYEEDLDKCRAEMERAQSEGEASFVARVNKADGGFVWCKVHLLLLRDVDGQLSRVLGFLSNIDAIKRQADIFKMRAEKDALTGFYNKGATIALVNEALMHNYEVPHAMMVLDIDNFKQINDTMGHIAGDAVLAEATERVRGLFRSDDILGRVGGDEFVVLLSGIDDRERVERKARDVLDAFYTMSINAGGVLNVSASIGIDIARKRVPSSYEELFRRADHALYQTKDHGKNGYVIYDDLPGDPASSGGAEK